MKSFRLLFLLSVSVCNVTSMKGSRTHNVNKTVVWLQLGEGYSMKSFGNWKDYTSLCSLFSVCCEKTKSIISSLSVEWREKWPSGSDFSSCPEESESKFNDKPENNKIEIISTTSEQLKY